MTQDLILAESKPQSLYRVATDAAGLCKDIVLKTAVRITGRKYVRCEGWMAIATAHGCIASSLDVAKVDGGYVAKGVIRRMSDGAILSEAQGFVGLDEAAWAKRPEYACRAMAQTRAISRACRAAFAHVVVLIDSDLSTTPAEEVPAEGFDDAPPAPAPTSRLVEVAPAPTPAPAQRPSANVVLKPVSTDAKDIFGIIRKVASKPTSNGGTRYGILIEPAGEGTGVWLNTFDDVMGGLAKQLENVGVTAQYKEGKYGKDLVTGTLQEEMP
jgi:hypothetical protein